MSNKLTGQALADFALSKLGTSYVYGAKGADGLFTTTKLNSLAKSYSSVFNTTYITKAKKLVGKVCCDCSGLISWYTGKVLGSAQLYSTATKRGTISAVDKAPIGAILWKSGHVGVYIGNGYCIEEKGIDYGCVKSKISNTSFTHWLTFDYMAYEDVSTTSTTSKAANPYTKPTATIKKDMKGDSVKWVQFELKEAGYDINIDGDFGNITLEYVEAFQQSCKLSVDGIVGTNTIKAFVAN